MNYNKKNRRSIFSIKPILLIILCCLFFMLYLSSTGCETITGESTAVESTDNTVKTEEQSDSGSSEDQKSEDSSSEEGSQKETVAEAEMTEENEEKALPEDAEKGDKAENNDNESITIRVYYADEMGEFLVGESRVLHDKNSYIDSLIELMKIPLDSSLISLIPETTQVYSVEVGGGAAEVNLSSNFVNDRFESDTADLLLVYSIVNTLTEFPDINSVIFYIEGERLNTLGILDLSKPLYRKNDLIIR